MRLGSAITLAFVLCGSAWLTAQTTQPASQPADNVDYWLDQAEPADGETVTDEAPPADPPITAPARAVPGVIQFSDGRILAGRIWTTAGRTLDLYVGPASRWRRVPLAATLSVTAERIVSVFKENTLEVIENDIPRLAEVHGVGKKRMEMISRGWEEQRAIKDVMLFLHREKNLRSIARCITTMYLFFHSELK